jgi:hypothetical protein
VSHLCTTTLDGKLLGYERRHPEKTVLYRVVADHMQTLFAEAEARSPHGYGYPSYVKHEFERFLGCGLACRGFARIACRCGFERLVPYSCKGRAICPSCLGRRMADTAAHLVDHVLPKAPYRLWTLSLPKRMRVRVVADPPLLTKVISMFLRTIMSYQRRRARALGVRRPLSGAVTFVQLLGSVLQLTPHAHSWIPDGVFTLDDTRTLQFVRLPPPTDDDIAKLLCRIHARVCSLIDKADQDGADEPDDSQHAVLSAQAEALQVPLFSIPLGPDELPYRPLCAAGDGFSLHADLAIHQDDRAGLERMLRYGLRPPFSQKRLSLTPDGTVRLQLRKPWHTGQRDIVFEPVEFLRRLAAGIPHPNQHLVRFHGVVAPRATVRPLLKTLLPNPPPKEPGHSPVPPPSDDLAPDGAAGPLPAEPEPTPEYRRPWAQLLKRVFGHDVLVCPKCSGPMRRIQFVDDPAVIERICSHLGLPTAAPPVAPARGPPQQDLNFDA